MRPLLIWTACDSGGLERTAGWARLDKFPPAGWLSVSIIGEADG